MVVHKRLLVHFLNVGQADCILIQTPAGKNFLIDAGNNDDRSKVLNYLGKYSIRQIDYLVGTHPHEDHLGALDDIIRSYNVGKFFMPVCSDYRTFYHDVTRAAAAKGLTIIPATRSIELFIDGCRFKFLSPISTKYKNPNDYSVVIMLEYGSYKFLFMGDASSVVEQQLLRAESNLHADVLKVGHHGSTLASSQQFLDAVRPHLAIISCGPNGPYMHPDLITVHKLEALNCSVMQTDQHGDILISTDGNVLYS
jgi:beta-lactamase superfamily II metal-dependent hydrolase